MMTNSKTWSAIVNTNQHVNVNTTENNLAVVKKEMPVSENKGLYYSKPFHSSRRYSIDDNGGGYKGL